MLRPELVALGPCRAVLRDVLDDCPLSLSEGSLRTGDDREQIRLLLVIAEDWRAREATFVSCIASSKRTARRDVDRQD